LLVQTDTLKKDLESDERALTEMMARVLRKRKILELAQKRAEEKKECLVREMEEEGEDFSMTVVASLFHDVLPSFSGETSGLVPDTR